MKSDAMLYAPSPYSHSIIENNAFLRHCLFLSEENIAPLSHALEEETVVNWWHETVVVIIIVE